MLFDNHNIMLGTERVDLLVVLPEWMIFGWVFFPFQGRKVEACFHRMHFLALMITTSICANIHGPVWFIHRTGMKMELIIIMPSAVRGQVSASDADPPDDVNGLRCAAPAVACQRRREAGSANRCCGKGRDIHQCKQINSWATSHFWQFSQSDNWDEEQSAASLLLISRFTVSSRWGRVLTDRNWPVDTQVRSLYRDIPPHTVRTYHILQTELDPSRDRDHEELTQTPVLTDPLGYYT